MPCFHPIPAWRAPSGYITDPVNEKSIVFNNPNNPFFESLMLPCGQCVGCRLERSRQWALRCVHEASLYDENCFLTLTYDDEHLPKGGSLNVEDIQLFIKRLRRRIEPKKLRFFQCGEYGSLNDRPHHHVLLFGYDFPDKEVFFNGLSGYVYRSPMLESLWPFGFSSIGDVTFESAAYVARYILKKVNGDAADEHYKGKRPEFITMSRRPGIASGWFDKYGTDLYPKDFITVQDGLKCRPARFYDRLFESSHGKDEMKKIKDKRKLVAQSPEYQSEMSVSRLKIKEQYKLLTIKQLRRNFEL